MYQAMEDDFLEIFHVHTSRCKHASADEDYEYVEAAMKLGAKRIVFTDHSPFPNNPFTNRMDIEQLPEYIDSMKKLKKEYVKGIEVLAGLEMEYLPSFQKFYKEMYALYQAKDLDLLILGQHFFEKEDGSYSFLDEDKTEEYKGLSKAMIEGTDTGIFQVIAHPDRVFRNYKGNVSEQINAFYNIIHAAMKNNLALEKNYSSMRREGQYNEHFWIRAASTNVIKGYDAHSVKEMLELWKEHYGFFISQSEINRLLGGN